MKILGVAHFLALRVTWADSIISVATVASQYGRGSNNTV